MNSEKGIEVMKIKCLKYCSTILMSLILILGLETQSYAATITDERAESITADDETSTGHHTANTALGLTSNQMGPTLQDSAGSEDNWYYFTVPANTKVTTLLESPTGSDYDLILYTYDDANSYITPVATSGYSGDGVLDRISYVSSSQMVYFLQVKPVTAATASDAYIYFIVRTDSVFDSNEPNEISARHMVIIKTV